MTITFNKLAELNRPVFHNIQGINLGFDEFDDLTDDPQAKAYAHRAIQASEATPSKNKLQYHAIDFIFERNTWLPSRFGNGSYPVWYGALDLKTSFYETIYHWQRIFLEAPQGFNQSRGQPIKTLRTVFTVTCQAALIDLRNKAAQQTELTNPDPLHYPETQQMGRRIYREGYPGLITQSVRREEGENIAAFRKEILSAPAHDNDYSYEYDLQSNKTVVKQSSSAQVLLVV